MLGDHVADQQPPAGGGHGSHIGTGLDLVGDDAVGAAGELFHAADVDGVGARALDVAPMEFRKLARSTIWGSLAAFSMAVVPSARAAAIMMFMVAPTETMSRYTVAPVRPPPLATAWTRFPP